MLQVKHQLAFAALFCAVQMPASFAASSTASLAADSASTSVGSVSDSFKGSSNSSTTKTAAAGDYQIVQVAVAVDRPGMVAIQLQAVAGQGSDAEFTLFVPQAVIEHTPLAAGQIVTAQTRSYGTEFSDQQTKAAFFLVLNDAAYQDLKTNAVTL